jgi:DNA-binding YbaB/EbfC family protein
MKDIMGLMKQAQQMQARMADLQNELESVIVEGQSGAGMVKVTMNAKGAMKSVSIDPALFKPEEREIVEDLIVAATEDARRKGEEAAAEKMKAITAGLPLPPGMKLPF